MDAMVKEWLTEKVNAIKNAPSCCAELKKVCEEWLEKQNLEATQKLIDELKADVQPIEMVIQFFQSETAANIFGKEQAQAILQHAQDVKAQGGKWCDCPACANGRVVLDHAEHLLK